MQFDTLIQGGTIVTASDTYASDIGIADGRIAAIARELPRESARQVLDVGSLQLSWDAAWALRQNRPASCPVAVARPASGPTARSLPGAPTPTMSLTELIALVQSQVAATLDSPRDIVAYLAFALAAGLMLGVLFLLAFNYKSLSVRWSQVDVGAELRVQESGKLYGTVVAFERNHVFAAGKPGPAYKVRVAQVAIINMPAKARRVGRTLTEKPAWKKAIVTLRAGDKIDLI